MAGGLLALIVALAGCTAGRAHIGPSPPLLLPPGSLPPPTVTLAGVRLVADLTEAPARWEKVAFIPFGEGVGELGYQPAREFPTREPSSFGLAPDGSIWIVDQDKARFAHYSADGRYLGQIEGFDHQIQDVVTLGGVVYGLANEILGRVVTLGANGASPPFQVNEAGRPVYVRYLIPTPQGLYAQTGGYSLAHPPTGPIGLSQLDIPGSGEVHLEAGIPLGPEVVVDVSAPGNQDLQVRYRREDRTTVQPIHIEVRSGPDSAVPAAVGPGGFMVLDQDVYMYVQIAPMRPDDAARYGDGRYLLRVGTSPVLWERLPSPRIDDDQQVRRLAMGPDGSLYLMVLERRGARILRRP